LHNADDTAAGIGNCGKTAPKCGPARSHYDFAAERRHLCEHLIEICDPDDAEPAGLGVLALGQRRHAGAGEPAARKQKVVLPFGAKVGCHAISDDLPIKGGDALRLFWFSSAASRHSRNLKRNPAAAVTVYRPTQQWREIRGVQMRGTVSVVRDPARRSAIAAAYSARFQLGTAFQAVQARSRLYEFQPSWIRYLDNSIRFGYKFEFSPPLPTGLGAGAAGEGTVAIRSRRG